MISFRGFSQFLLLRPRALLSTSKSIIYTMTERHGREVGTPASYSGDPDFKSRSGDRLF
jgi:hypothetical protein